MYYLFFLFFMSWLSPLFSLPRVGLGTSSFLDGGPLRPRPGIYLQQYFQYYQANKIVNNDGKKIIPNFSARSVGVATQFVYQFDNTFPGWGTLGFNVTLPFILYSKIADNPLSIRTSGSGIADLLMGFYVQWNTIMIGDRPLFVHRMEFNASLPVGKNRVPEKLVNPGNDFLFIDPYWSATLYITRKLGISWKLSYLWCGKHNTLRAQDGQAIHGNFALEYPVFKKMYAGINGYFLQQLTDDTIRGVKLKNFNERIFALGPGILYIFVPNADFVMFANLYFEFGARNFTQGTRFVMRLFKHF